MISKSFFYFGTNSGYSLPFGVKVVIIDQRFVFDPGIAGKVVSMIQTQEAEKKGYYGFSKNLDQIKKIYFMKNLTGQKYICRVQFDDGKTVHFIQTIGFLDDLEILFKKIALDKIVE